MLVPAPRLLLASLVLALPLAAVGGMFPHATGACAVGGAVLAAIAALDGIAALRRSAAISARTPPFVRLTRGIEGSFSVILEQHHEPSCEVRLGVNLPLGVETTTPVMEVVAASGESVVSWPCTGQARGDHALHELYLESGSPLELWRARRPLAIELAFRVYPDLRDRATAALFLRTANIGTRVRRQVGKGREFENLRQYLPGDSFEDIHWKATAKRGFPAVKLHRVEHAQEVYAVVDASRLSAREGILESFVEAVLHLALVTEKQGDRFGLVLFSNRTLKFVRARSGMDHFRLCREMIYNVQAERVSPDFRDVFTTLQVNLRRRALLVFFTSLDDALLAESFEHDIPMLSRRHVVRVNVRRTAGLRPLYEGEPPANVDALYSGLAGQMASNRMRVLEIALKGRGVELTVTDAERIKMQVAASYLDVKRRQIL